jgi:SAM-dependent methyltransferase
MRQRIVGQVVRQFHRPHGVSGHLVGWVMAHRSSNLQRNRWAVSLLDVQPGDRVLEIGFGPGIAVKELSRLATQGQVFGVDHSSVMVRQATGRNRAAVRSGRVVLFQGSIDALPDFGEPVDKILTVNSMGFWPDPVARLGELRTRMRPGGTIAIVSQPRCRGATSETSVKAANEIEAALRSAGYSGTQVETLDLDPPVVCVLATP